MPTREHRDAAYSLSTESALVSYVLHEGLGMIPDPKEPWFTMAAIAKVMSKELKSLQNRVSMKKLPRHPAGAYFRISDVVKELADDDS